MLDDDQLHDSVVNNARSNHNGQDERGFEMPLFTPIGKLMIGLFLLTVDIQLVGRKR